MATRIEYLAREYLRFYFPNDESVYNWRPDFLRNEATGKNFEIDIYYPFLHFGVEVNSLFHETRQARARDTFKIAHCRAEGIALFQVWNKRQLLRLRYVLQQNFPLEKRLALKLPVNEYLAIMDYEPKQTRAGQAVAFRAKYDRGMDAQISEVAGLRKRRELRAA